MNYAKLPRAFEQKPKPIAISKGNSSAARATIHRELTRSIGQIIAQGSIPFLDEAMLTSKEFQQHSQALALQLTIAQAIRSHSTNPPAIDLNSNTAHCLMPMFKD